MERDRRVIGLDIGATKTLGVVARRRRRGRWPRCAQPTDRAPRASCHGRPGRRRSWRDRRRPSGRSASASRASSTPSTARSARGQPRRRRRLAAPARSCSSERLGVPVLLENDVNAAALGAAALDRRDRPRYLSIGTGLAAGLVLDGRLRRGAHGAAGEIGHIPVDPHGVAVPCGQRGCLETVASGSALAAAWPSGDVPRGAGRCSPPPAPATRPRSRRASGFAAGVAGAIRLLSLGRRPAASCSAAGSPSSATRCGRRSRRRCSRSASELAVPGLARPGRPGPAGAGRSGRRHGRGPLGTYPARPRIEPRPRARRDEGAKQVGDDSTQLPA